jgi:endoglucanase
MQAIAHLVGAAAAGHGDLADMPTVAEAQDYYSAALTLLARLAWQDLKLQQA